MQLALEQFRVNFFKIMTHPLRIKILEMLSTGPKSVHELQSILNRGSIVTQQLSIIRAKHLITSQKEGTHIVYMIQDPLIIHLLDVAKQIFNNQLTSFIKILEP
jgi:DNA-binding transcriptional ArsR family regulator